MSRAVGVAVGLMLLGGIAFSARPAGADYFSDVEATGRCWSGCDIPAVPERPQDYVFLLDPGIELTQAHGAFAELIRAFTPLTGIAGDFLALPAPASYGDYDRRISEFYAAAFRENDHLEQALAYVERELDRVERRLVDKRHTTAARTATLPTRQDLLALEIATADRLEAERALWRDRVEALRETARAIGFEARETRADAVDIVRSVLPPHLPSVSETQMGAAEPLVTYHETAPPQPAPALEAAALAPSEAPAIAQWYPVVRALGLDLTLPPEVKIDHLRQLEPAMAATSRAFDHAFPLWRSKRDEEIAADAEAFGLALTHHSLDGEIAAARLRAETAAAGVDDARRDHGEAVQEVTLRAAQNWLWTRMRDDIVLPGARDFLIANGLTKVADGLGAAPLSDALDAARSVNWSTIADIRGIDEFMDVQRTILGLLDPLQSRILDSARINALATPEAGRAFSRQVAEALGEDASAVLGAAGGFETDGPYRKLLGRLLGAR